MNGYGMNPNPPDDISMYCHCGRLDCELCWADLQSRGLVGCCDGCCERRLAVELVAFADGDSVGCGKGAAKLCVACRSCSQCGCPLSTQEDYYTLTCWTCRLPMTNKLACSIALVPPSGVLGGPLMTTT